MRSDQQRNDLAKYTVLGMMIIIMHNIDVVVVEALKRVGRCFS